MSAHDDRYVQAYLRAANLVGRWEGLAEQQGEAVGASMRICARQLREALRTVDRTEADAAADAAAAAELRACTLLRNSLRDIGNGLTGVFDLLGMRAERQ